LQKHSIFYKALIIEKTRCKHAARFEGFTNQTSLGWCDAVDAATGFIGHIPGTIWAK
jgi:hypothetical protein